MSAPTWVWVVSLGFKNWDKGIEDLESQEFETTYVNLIEQAFREAPEKIALAFLGVTVTFGELDNRANQFANMLIKNPKSKALDHTTHGTVMSSAAPFPLESQVILENIVGQGKLLEVYGMTETSPIMTMNPSKGTKKLGSVGMPILNTSLKLVDPVSGADVALGEAGEICVRGSLVMHGYFNRPDATREAVDEDGYIHTGDVGIMDEDRFPKIIDRTKDMIMAIHI